MKAQDNKIGVDVFTRFYDTRLLKNYPSEVIFYHLLKIIFVPCSKFTKKIKNLILASIFGWV